MAFGEANEIDSRGIKCEHVGLVATLEVRSIYEVNCIRCFGKKSLKMWTSLLCFCDLESG